MLNLQEHLQELHIASPSIKHIYIVVYTFSPF